MLSDDICRYSGVLVHGLDRTPRDAARAEVRIVEGVFSCDRCMFGPSNAPWRFADRRLGRTGAECGSWLIDRGPGKVLVLYGRAT